MQEMFESKITIKRAFSRLENDHFLGIGLIKTDRLGGHHPFSS